jgi:hypothetical protein
MPSGWGRAPAAGPGLEVHYQGDRLAYWTRHVLREGGAHYAVRLKPLRR